MILERGDMWDIYGKTGVFLVTTNPVINREGKLVMGRGIAKQFADRFPNGPQILADMVRAFPSRYVGNVYHEPTFGLQHVGYFMVKNHWREQASIPVIMRSVAELLDNPMFKDMRVDVNFPGIGNGRLTKEEVLPIVSYLPNNVHVWEYGH